MVREFKKVGAAAAVAGALLATAATNSNAAVQLSTPGDVMLVPYVLCDDADSANRTNTLVGLITFYKERMGLYDPTDGTYYPAPTGLTGLTGLPLNPGLPERRSVKNPVTRTLHWYFFNSRSEHQVDGIIPITDNDFVRFDWCSTIQDLGADLDGVKGYLIFVDDVADTASSTVFPVPHFALYGHAYQIWQLGLASLHSGFGKSSFFV
jgi:hypothetical protein